MLIFCLFLFFWEFAKQADWYRPGVKLDYPAGGTGAVVDALANGVTKHGGEVGYHL